MGLYRRWSSRNQQKCTILSIPTKFKFNKLKKNCIINVTRLGCNHFPFLIGPSMHLMHDEHCARISFGCGNVDHEVVVVRPKIVNHSTRVSEAGSNLRIVGRHNHVEILCNRSSLFFLIMVPCNDILHVTVSLTRQDLSKYDVRHTCRQTAPLNVKQTSQVVNARGLFIAGCNLCHMPSCCLNFPRSYNYQHQQQKTALSLHDL